MITSSGQIQDAVKPFASEAEGKKDRAKFTQG